MIVPAFLVLLGWCAVTAVSAPSDDTIGPRPPLPGDPLFAFRGGHALQGGQAVDGDTIPDFATSSGSWADCPQVVTVRSGRDGAIICTFRDGRHRIRDLALIPDLDGDGRAELVLVGELDGLGYVLVVSARTHEVLSTHIAPTPALIVTTLEETPSAFAVAFSDETIVFRARSRLHVSHREGWHQGVTSPGDLDGDGFAELAFFAGPWADTKPGYDVIIVSGNSGEELRTHEEGATGLDRVGDLDGDACDDYVIGSYLDEERRGRAEIRSGRTGRILFHLAAPHEYRGTTIDPRDGRFGASVSGVGDVNGDGVPDVAVGSPSPYGPATGYVAVYSGADGALIQLSRVITLNEIALPQPFGDTVAGLGDIDGDGLAEYLVGTDLHFGLYDCAQGPTDLVHVIAGGAD